MNATDAIKQPLAQSVTPRSGQLGFWMCTALVVGNTIGIGIFMLPASLAPYGLNALIAWAITVFGCVSLPVVFALLARESGPRRRAVRVHASTAGRFPAFLAIWCYWVSCWMTNAAMAVGSSAISARSAGVRRHLARGEAVSLIWLFVAINLLGVRAGGRVQLLTTVLKLAPMAASSWPAPGCC